MSYLNREEALRCSPAIEVTSANSTASEDHAVVTVTSAAWPGSGTITFTGLGYIELIWVAVPIVGNRWMPVYSTATLG
jgi:hypothetical protein